MSVRLSIGHYISIQQISRNVFAYAFFIVLKMWLVGCMSHLSRKSPPGTSEWGVLQASTRFPTRFQYTTSLVVRLAGRIGSHCDWLAPDRRQMTKIGYSEK